MNPNSQGYSSSQRPNTEWYTRAPPFRGRGRGRGRGKKKGRGHGRGRGALLPPLYSLSNSHAGVAQETGPWDTRSPYSPSAPVDQRAGFEFNLPSILPPEAALAIGALQEALNPSQPYVLGREAADFAPYSEPDYGSSTPPIQHLEYRDLRPQQQLPREQQWADDRDRFDSSFSQQEDFPQLYERRYSETLYKQESGLDSRQEHIESYHTRGDSYSSGESFRGPESSFQQQFGYCGPGMPPQLQEPPPLENPSYFGPYSQPGAPYNSSQGSYSDFSDHGQGSRSYDRPYMEEESYRGTGDPSNQPYLTDLERPYPEPHFHDSETSYGEESFQRRSEEESYGLREPLLLEEVRQHSGVSEVAPWSQHRTSHQRSPSHRTENRPDSRPDARPRARPDTRPKPKLEPRPDARFRSDMGDRPRISVDSGPRIGMESRPRNDMDSGPGIGMDSRPRSGMDSRPRSNVGERPRSKPRDEGRNRGESERAKERRSDTDRSSRDIHSTRQNRTGYDTISDGHSSVMQRLGPPSDDRNRPLSAGPRSSAGETPRSTIESRLGPEEPRGATIQSRLGPHPEKSHIRSRLGPEVTGTGSQRGSPASSRSTSPGFARRSPIGVISSPHQDLRVQLENRRTDPSPKPLFPSHTESPAERLQRPALLCNDEAKPLSSSAGVKSGVHPSARSPSANLAERHPLCNTQSPDAPVNQPKLSHTFTAAATTTTTTPLQSKTRAATDPKKNLPITPEPKRPTAVAAMQSEAVPPGNRKGDKQYDGDLVPRRTEAGSAESRPPAAKNLGQAVDASGPKQQISKKQPPIVTLQPPHATSPAKTEPLLTTKPSISEAESPKRASTHIGHHSRQRQSDAAVRTMASKQGKEHPTEAPQVEVSRSRASQSRVSRELPAETQTSEIQPTRTQLRPSDKPSKEEETKRSATRGEKGHLSSADKPSRHEEPKHGGVSRGPTRPLHHRSLAEPSLTAIPREIGSSSGKQATEVQQDLSRDPARSGVECPGERGERSEEPKKPTSSQSKPVIPGTARQHRSSTQESKSVAGKLSESTTLKTSQNLPPSVFQKKPIVATDSKTPEQRSGVSSRDIPVSSKKPGSRDPTKAKAPGITAPSKRSLHSDSDPGGAPIPVLGPKYATQPSSGPAVKKVSSSSRSDRRDDATRSTDVTSRKPPGKPAVANSNTTAKSSTASDKSEGSSAPRRRRHSTTAAREERRKLDIDGKKTLRTGTPPKSGASEHSLPRTDGNTKPSMKESTKLHVRRASIGMMDIQPPNNPNSLPFASFESEEKPTSDDKLATVTAASTGSTSGLQETSSQDRGGLPVKPTPLFSTTGDGDNRKREQQEPHGSQEEPSATPPPQKQPRLEDPSRSLQNFRIPRLSESRDQSSTNSPRNRRPSQESREPSQEGGRPSQEGRRPSQEGREPSQKGGRPSQEGREPSQKGRRPSWDGRRLTQDSRTTFQESGRRSQDSRRPSQEGRRPSQESRRPSQEGRRPSQESSEPSQASQESSEPSQEGVVGGEGSNVPELRRPASLSESRSSTSEKHISVSTMSEGEVSDTDSNPGLVIDERVNAAWWDKNDPDAVFSPGNEPGTSYMNFSQPSQPMETPSSSSAAVTVDPSDKKDKRFSSSQKPERLAVDVIGYSLVKQLLTVHCGKKKTTLLRKLYRSANSIVTYVKYYFHCDFALMCYLHRLYAGYAIGKLTRGAMQKWDRAGDSLFRMELRYLHGRCQLDLSKWKEAIDRYFEITTTYVVIGKAKLREVIETEKRTQRAEKLQRRKELRQERRSQQEAGETGERSAMSQQTPRCQEQELLTRGQKDLGETGEKSALLRHRRLSDREEPPQQDKPRREQQVLGQRREEGLDAEAALLKEEARLRKGLEQKMRDRDQREQSKRQQQQQPGSVAGTATPPPGPSVAMTDVGSPGGPGPGHALVPPPRHEVVITPPLSVQSLTETIRGLQSMEEALATPPGRTQLPLPSATPLWQAPPLATPINLTSSSTTVAHLSPTSSQPLTTPTCSASSSRSVAAPTGPSHISESLWFEDRVGNIEKSPKEPDAGSQTVEHEQSRLPTPVQDKIPELMKMQIGGFPAEMQPGMQSGGHSGLNPGMQTGLDPRPQGPGLQPGKQPGMQNVVQGGMEGRMSGGGVQGTKGDERGRQGRAELDPPGRVLQKPGQLKKKRSRRKPPFQRRSARQRARMKRQERKVLSSISQLTQLWVNEATSDTHRSSDAVECSGSDSSRETFSFSLSKLIGASPQRSDMDPGQGGAEPSPSTQQPGRSSDDQEGLWLGAEGDDLNPVAMDLDTSTDQDEIDGETTWEHHEVDPGREICEDLTLDVTSMNQPETVPIPDSSPAATTMSEIVKGQQLESVISAIKADLEREAERRQPQWYDYSRSSLPLEERSSRYGTELEAVTYPTERQDFEVEETVVSSEFVSAAEYVTVGGCEQEPVGEVLIGYHDLAVGYSGSGNRDASHQPIMESEAVGVCGRHPLPTIVVAEAGNGSPDFTEPVMGTSEGERTVLLESMGYEHGDPLMGVHQLDYSASFQQRQFEAGSAEGVARWTSGPAPLSLAEDRSCMLGPADPLMPSSPEELDAPQLGLANREGPLQPAISVEHLESAEEQQKVEYRPGESMFDAGHDFFLDDTQSHSVSNPVLFPNLSHLPQMEAGVSDSSPFRVLRPEHGERGRVPDVSVSATDPSFRSLLTPEAVVSSSVEVSAPAKTPGDDSNRERSLSPGEIVSPSPGPETGIGIEPDKAQQNQPIQPAPSRENSHTTSSRYRRPSSPNHEPGRHDRPSNSQSPYKSGRHHYRYRSRSPDHYRRRSRSPVRRRYRRSRSRSRSPSPKSRYGEGSSSQSPGSRRWRPRSSSGRGESPRASGRRHRSRSRSRSPSPRGRRRRDIRSRSMSPVSRSRRPRSNSPPSRRKRSQSPADRSSGRPYERERARDSGRSDSRTRSGYSSNRPPRPRSRSRSPPPRRRRRSTGSGSEDELELLELKKQAIMSMIERDGQGGASDAKSEWEVVSVYESEELPVGAEESGDAVEGIAIDCIPEVPSTDVKVGEEHKSLGAEKSGELVVRELASSVVVQQSSGVELGSGTGSDAKQLEDVEKSKETGFQEQEKVEVSKEKPTAPKSTKSVPSRGGSVTTVSAGPLKAEPPQASIDIEPEVRIRKVERASTPAEERPKAVGVAKPAARVPSVARLKTPTSGPPSSTVSRQTSPSRSRPAVSVKVLPGNNKTWDVQEFHIQVSSEESESSDSDSDLDGLIGRVSRLAPSTGLDTLSDEISKMLTRVRREVEAKSRAAPLSPLTSDSRAKLQSTSSTDSLDLPSPPASLPLKQQREYIELQRKLALHERKKQRKEGTEGDGTGSRSQMQGKERGKAPLVRSSHAKKVTKSAKATEWSNSGSESEKPSKRPRVKKSAVKKPPPTPPPEAEVNKTARREAEESRGRIAEYQSAIKSSRSHLVSSQRQLTSLVHQLAECESEMEEHELKLELLRKQLKIVEEAHTGCKKKRSDLQDEVRSTRDRISRHSAAIQEMEKKLGGEREARRRQLPREDALNATSSGVSGLKDVTQTEIVEQSDAIQVTGGPESVAASASASVTQPVIAKTSKSEDPRDKELTSPHHSLDTAVTSLPITTQSEIPTLSSKTLFQQVAIVYSPSPHPRQQPLSTPPTTVAMQTSFSPAVPEYESISDAESQNSDIICRDKASVMPVLRYTDAQSGELYPPGTQLRLEGQHKETSSLSLLAVPSRQFGVEPVSDAEDSAPLSPLEMEMVSDSETTIPNASRKGDCPSLAVVENAQLSPLEMEMVSDSESQELPAHPDSKASSVALKLPPAIEAISDSEDSEMKIRVSSVFSLNPEAIDNSSEAVPPIPPDASAIEAISDSDSEEADSRTVTVSEPNLVSSTLAGDDHQLGVSESLSLSHYSPVQVEAITDSDSEIDIIEVSEPPAPPLDASSQELCAESTLDTSIAARGLDEDWSQLHAAANLEMVSITFASVSTSPVKLQGTRDPSLTDILPPQSLPSGISGLKIASICSLCPSANLDSSTSDATFSLIPSSGAFEGGQESGIEETIRDGDTESRGQIESSVASSISQLQKEHSYSLSPTVFEILTEPPEHVRRGSSSEPPEWVRTRRRGSSSESLERVRTRRRGSSSESLERVRTRRRRSSSGRSGSISKLEHGAMESAAVDADVVAVREASPGVVSQAVTSSSVQSKSRKPNKRKSKPPKRLRLKRSRTSTLSLPLLSSLLSPASPALSSTLEQTLHSALSPGLSALISPSHVAQLLPPSGLTSSSLPGSVVHSPSPGSPGSGFSGEAAITATTVDVSTMAGTSLEGTSASLVYKSTGVSLLLDSALMKTLQTVSVAKWMDATGCGLQCPEVVRDEEVSTLPPVAPDTASASLESSQPQAIPPSVISSAATSRATKMSSVETLGPAPPASKPSSTVCSKSQTFSSDVNVLSSSHAAVIGEVPPLTAACMTAASHPHTPSSTSGTCVSQVSPFHSIPLPTVAISCSSTRVNPFVASMQSKSRNLASIPTAVSLHPSSTGKPAVPAPTKVVSASPVPRMQTGNASHMTASLSEAFSSPTTPPPTHPVSSNACRTSETRLTPPSIVSAAMVAVSTGTSTQPLLMTACPTATTGPTASSSMLSAPILAGRCASAAAGAGILPQLSVTSLLQPGSVHPSLMLPPISARATSAPGDSTISSLLTRLQSTTLPPAIAAPILEAVAVTSSCEDQPRAAVSSPSNLSTSAAVAAKDVDSVLTPDGLFILPASPSKTALLLPRVISDLPLEVHSSAINEAALTVLAAGRRTEWEDKDTSVAATDTSGTATPTSSVSPEPPPSIASGSSLTSTVLTTTSVRGLTSGATTTIGSSTTVYADSQISGRPRAKRDIIASLATSSTDNITSTTMASMEPVIFSKGLPNSAALSSASASGAPPVGGRQSVRPSSDWAPLTSVSKHSASAKPKSGVASQAQLVVPLSSVGRRASAPPFGQQSKLQPLKPVSAGTRPPPRTMSSVIATTLPAAISKLSQECKGSIPLILSKSQPRTVKTSTQSQPLPISVPPTSVPLVHLTPQPAVSSTTVTSKWDLQGFSTQIQNFQEKLQKHLKEQKMLLAAAVQGGGGQPVSSKQAKPSDLQESASATSQPEVPLSSKPPSTSAALAVKKSGVLPEKDLPSKVPGRSSSAPGKLTPKPVSSLTKQVSSKHNPAKQVLRDAENITAAKRSLSPRPTATDTAKPQSRGEAAQQKGTTGSVESSVSEALKLLGVEIPIEKLRQTWLSGSLPSPVLNIEDVLESVRPTPSLSSLLHPVRKMSLAGKIATFSPPEPMCIIPESVLSTAERQESGRTLSDNEAEKEPQGTGDYSPYVSPLLAFQSYRLSPFYRTHAKLPLSSLTYCSKLDPKKILCRFELLGICNNANCSAQHLKNVTPSREELVQDLIGYAPTIAGCSLNELSTVDENLPELQKEISDKIAAFSASLIQTYGGKITDEQLYMLTAHRVNEEITKVNPSGRKTLSYASWGERHWAPERQGRPELRSGRPLANIKPTLVGVAGPGGDGMPVLLPLGETQRPILSSDPQRYFSQGERQMSRTAEERVGGSPSDVGAWLQLAGGALGRGEWREALGYLEEGLKSNAASEELWVEYLRVKGHDPSSSVEDLDTVCTRAVAGSPSYAVVFECIRLAPTYDSKKKWIETGFRVVSVQPPSPPSPSSSHQHLELLLSASLLDQQSSRSQSAVDTIHAALFAKTREGQEVSEHLTDLSSQLTQPDQLLACLSLIHLVYLGSLPASLLASSPQPPARIGAKEPFLVPWREEVALSQDKVEEIRQLFRVSIELGSTGGISPSSESLATTTSGIGSPLRTQDQATTQTPPPAGARPASDTQSPMVSKNIHPPTTPKLLENTQPPARVQRSKNTKFPISAQPSEDPLTPPHPECLPLFQNLALFEATHGSRQRAQALIEGQLAACPEAVELWILLARLGESREESRDILRRAMLSCPLRTELYYHAARLELSSQGRGAAGEDSPVVGLAVRWLEMGVRQFYSTLEDGPADVQDTLLMYRNLLGQLVPYDCPLPKVSDNADPKLLKKQLVPLWMCYCLLVELTSDPSSTPCPSEFQHCTAEEAFESAVHSVHEGEGLQLLWREYLGYVRSQAVQGRSSVQSFKLFSDCVLRSLVAVETTRPYPHPLYGQPDRYHTFSFHNEVIDLLLSCLPFMSGYKLAVLQRFTLLLPHNPVLVARLVECALDQTPDQVKLAQGVLASYLADNPQCHFLWSMAISVELRLGHSREARWMYHQAVMALPLHAEIWKEFLLFELREILASKSPSSTHTLLSDIIKKTQEIGLNLRPFLQEALRKPPTK